MRNDLAAARLARAGLAVCTLLIGASAARADDYLGSYTTMISETDHYASDGYELDTVAQMIRQDRANFHRFGNADDPDQYDEWFRTEPARERFERLLERPGAVPQRVRRFITRGDTMIQVDVYRQSVVVSLLGG